MTAVTLADQAAKSAWNAGIDGRQGSIGKAGTRE